MRPEPRPNGFVSERVLDLVAGVGLVAILIYGFVSWRATGDAFPADMRGTTRTVLHRGFLEAALLGTDASAPAARATVQRMAGQLGVEVRWVEAAPVELLRRLERDSLDVLAGLDPELPGSAEYGVSGAYAVVGGRKRVIGVPSGENRLLAVADRAVRATNRRSERRRRS